MKIYMASKAKYGPLWQVLRANGANIISTWIDEWGVGQTIDWSDLWSRAIREASTADRVIVYRGAPSEILKGALVEVGAALAANVPVLAVGCSDLRFTHHPLVQPIDRNDSIRLKWPPPGKHGRGRLPVSDGLIDALIACGVSRDTCELCSIWPSDGAW
jgi:hypothetical protein